MQHTARLDSGMFDAVLSTLHTRTRVLSFQVPGQDVGCTKIECDPFQFAYRDGRDMHSST